MNYTKTIEVVLLLENALIVILLLGLWPWIKLTTRKLAVLLSLQVINAFLGNELVKMALNEPVQLVSIHWFQWLGVGLTTAASCLVTYYAWLQNPNPTESSVDKLWDAAKELKHEPASEKTVPPPGPAGGPGAAPGRV